MNETTSRRVLVIDDDEVDREMVNRALTTPHTNYQPFFAVDAESGRRKLEDGGWDCILLDYFLPEGDAFDLYADLLERSCAARPPVVLLTGNGGEKIAVDALKRGVQDYVSKQGLTPSRLCDAIEGAMESAAETARRENRSAELLRLSMHDALTGLPNRALFSDRLETQIQLAGRRHEHFAVMMIDLDRFKSINDDHGHLAGDRVLQEVAVRLQDSVRRSDTVARLGGDEFAVLLVTMQHEEAATGVAGKLGRLVDEPIDFGQELLQVGASIGIALWPDHGTDAVTLLRNADTAMYKAKRAGLAFAMYESGKAAVDAIDVVDRAPTATLARSASAGDLERIQINYQPQVDLETGTVVGREALLRWRHPVLGLLPTVGFLATAEQDSRAWSLGQHLIKNALQSWKSWNDEGISLPVAVNLPPLLLQDRDFVNWVVDCLRSIEASSGVLSVEAPGPNAMTDMRALQDGLQKLSNAGASITIEHRGANLTLLGYHKDLPVDQIKIDRPLALMLLYEGKSAMELQRFHPRTQPQRPRLAADGVDSETDLLAFMHLGCAVGQGLRFTPALSETQCLDWYRRWDASGRKSAFATGAAKHPSGSEDEPYISCQKDEKNATTEIDKRTPSSPHYDPNHDSKNPASPVRSSS